MKLWSLCSLVVAGLHLVYLDDAGTQLVSVSASGQSHPAVLQLPTPASSLTSVASSADKVFVRVGSNLVAVLPENLTLIKNDVSTRSGIAVHSHSTGQNIIISVQNTGKVITIDVVWQYIPVAVFILVNIYMIIN